MNLCLSVKLGSISYFQNHISKSVRVIKRYQSKKRKRMCPAFI